ncbi:H-NS family nucleoid-associated regulatory protein [Parazoarcus communis]|uniref:H-NS histone family protein n=1 Tax=Parazoarcus communis TaxID=41977 RepID=UPI001F3D602C|nr:H-NS histone family protein [Parazoarcus communis]
MVIDLKDYSLPQLRVLGNRIENEIRRQQLNSKAVLRRRLSSLARDHGLTLEEVCSDKAAEKIVEAPSSIAQRASARVQVAAKYRHPSNRELAWSGRGRQPHWVKAWLANGGSMDALAIAAEKMAPRNFRLQQL